MRRHAILAALTTAMLAAPTQAQTGQLNVELTSEMWALAGVCSQYSGYSVRNDALADWLNAQLANAANAAAVLDSKNTKLARISRDAAAVGDARSVTVREERSDRMTAGLMTRCRRLTNDPVAGRFFLTAEG